MTGSGLGGIGLKNSQQDGFDSTSELQQLATGCEQITWKSKCTRNSHVVTVYSNNVFTKNVQFYLIFYTVYKFDYLVLIPCNLGLTQGYQ